MDSDLTPLEERLALFMAMLSIGVDHDLGDPAVVPHRPMPPLMPSRLPWDGFS